MSSSSPLLRKYELFRIGQRLRSQEFSGSLSIQEPDGKTILVFRKGVPVRANSTLVSLSFPAFLLRKRQVDRQRLKRLLEESSEKGVRLEELLAARGHFSPKVLQRLKRELSEYVFSVMFHKDRVPYRTSSGDGSLGGELSIREHLELHEALFRAVISDDDVESMTRMFADRWDDSLVKTADFYRYLIQFRSVFYGEDITEFLMTSEPTPQLVMDNTADQESAIRQLFALSYSGMISFEAESEPSIRESTGTFENEVGAASENKTVVVIPDDAPRDGMVTAFIGEREVPFTTQDLERPQPAPPEDQRPDDIKSFFKEGFSAPPPKDNSPLAEDNAAPPEYLAPLPEDNVFEQELIGANTTSVVHPLPDVSAIAEPDMPSESAEHTTPDSPPLQSSNDPVVDLDKVDSQEPPKDSSPVLSPDEETMPTPDIPSDSADAGLTVMLPGTETTPEPEPEPDSVDNGAVSTSQETTGDPNITLPLMLNNLDENARAEVNDEHINVETLLQRAVEEAERVVAAAEAGQPVPHLALPESERITKEQSDELDGTVVARVYDNDPETEEEQPETLPPEEELPLFSQEPYPIPERPAVPEPGTDQSIERILEDVYRSMISRTMYQTLNVTATTPLSTIRDSAARLKNKYSLDQYRAYMLSKRARQLLKYVGRELDRARQVLTLREEREAYDELLGTDYGQERSVALDYLFKAEVAFQKGLAMIKADSWNEALSSFVSAVETNSRDPEYQAYRGWATYQASKTGQSDDTFAANKARNILERALAVDARHQRSLLFLARIEKDQGNINASRMWFERLHKLDPANDEVAAALEWLKLSSGVQRRSSSSTGFWNRIKGFFKK